jgi:hypothetical protein
MQNSSSKIHVKKLHLEDCSTIVYVWGSHSIYSQLTKIKEKLTTMDQINNNRRKLVYKLIPEHCRLCSLT